MTSDPVVEADSGAVDDASGLPDGSRAWVGRAHSQDEMRAAFERMAHGMPESHLAAWSTSLVESVTNIGLINADLHRAGFLVHAGGGAEEADHVRTLLVMRDRMANIASFHCKRVDAHGGTFGDCNECGLPWPCPTYDWARENSDRDPAIDCWDRTDDEDGGS